jgi:hypothetical protein
MLPTNPCSSFRLALLAAVAFGCSNALAQTIAWDPPTLTLGPSDVSLNGTLVVARNLHAAGATQTPTVNGVTFVGAFAPTGWTNASTLALQASTTGDVGYDLLLNSARATSAAATANPTGWGAIRLDTLGTLVVGRTYEIQCWFTDQRPGAGTAAIYDRQMEFSSAIGPATLVGGEVSNLGALVQGPVSGILDGDPDNAPALSSPDVAFGMHCTGRFTRTSATDQLWLLVRGSHPIPANNLRSHLTAFQIRDVSAKFTITGSGCPSSVGMSNLTVPQLPVIGQTLQIDMDNVAPLAVPVVVLGFSAIAPTSLVSLGLSTDPSCILITNPDAIAYPLPVSGGVASVTLAIPPINTLVGVQLFLQLGQNEPSGASITPQVIATVGF